ncbi:MAG: hypothetical protein HRT68_12845 [Flavobacteriaceae bacterium]|nr:hypothetical protein [Flavobacteriaceae bacterium]
MKKLILIVLPFLIFSFKSKNTSSCPCIQGKAIDLYTNKPLKRKKIYVDDKNYDPYNNNRYSDYYPGRTNSKGEFSFFPTCVDGNSLSFWFNINNYASINFTNIKIDNDKLIDTIDIGTVYLVPYDEELKIIEKINMGDFKFKKKKLKRYSINKIDSMFSLESYQKKYNMNLKSVDTLVSASKYNFGNKRGKGFLTIEYKLISFIRDLKTTPNNTYK